MTVLCLFPLVLCRPCCRRKRPDSPDPPDHPESSFAGYCLELAIWNFGTQGLLNIGLKTTESARSAFFTQLSVVITPVLAATIGCCKRRPVRVSFRVWMACFLALLGLYVMTSQPESPAETEETEVSGFYHWIRGIGKDDDDDDNDFSWTWEYLSATTTKLVQSLSFGDWCCLGSALLWSLYIYRLSDWGNRYDEAQTMFVKNIFMALLYTSWTIGAYFWTTLHAVDADAAQGSTLSPTDAIANATINGTATTTADSGDESGFILWEGWRDPIALGILFYSALSSGAISDVLQQTAQSHVPAAESNVILSLEPVFAAVLGAALLQEIPSARECAGGACIVLASVLASG
jgi:drug/metabolite transporter (DMT)-like permease